MNLIKQRKNYQIYKFRLTTRCNRLGFARRLHPSLRYGMQAPRKPSRLNATVRRSKNLSFFMKIIKDTFPIRCEICHQSDCFDQINEFCSRCKFRSTKNQITNLKPKLLSRPKNIIIEENEYNLTIIGKIYSEAD